MTAITLNYVVESTVAKWREMVALTRIKVRDSASIYSVQSPVDRNGEVDRSSEDISTAAIGLRSAIGFDTEASRQP